MQMPFDTMDSLIKHISQKHFFPVAIAPAAPLIMPFPACQSLKALRAWLDYRELRGETFNVPEFTEDVKRVWLKRSAFLDTLRG